MGREESLRVIKREAMFLCKGHFSFCQCGFVTGLTFVRELKTALIPYATFEFADVLLNSMLYMLTHSVGHTDERNEESMAYLNVRTFMCC